MSWSSTVEAFRRDMDEIRKLTPAPVRRIIRRLPEALDSAGRLDRQGRNRAEGPVDHR